MDWKSTRRLDRFEYELVDPNDIDTSRGFLAGVVSCSITLGYYTDTRAQASLEFVDGEYIENSLIRIHHYVDEWNYHNELGTFFVDEITPSFSNGANAYSVEMSSMLARVSEDYLPNNLAVPTRKSTNELLKELFNNYGVDYSFKTGIGSTYNEPTVYEVGENVLSVMFEIADKGNCRLEVDGHGIVNVESYVSPSDRSQIDVIDETMLFGEIVETSDFYSVPNRAIVHSKQNDTVVSGFADAPSSSPTARSRRGRRITKVYSVNDLKPFTNSQASAQAKRYLDNIDDVSTEIEVNSIYIPLIPGEVVNLVYAGEEHNAMLKSRELSLEPGMPCRDTFKVV